jgi:hypothetical protein
LQSAPLRSAHLDFTGGFAYFEQKDDVLSSENQEKQFFIPRVQHILQYCEVNFIIVFPITTPSPLSFSSLLLR